MGGGATTGVLESRRLQVGGRDFTYLEAGRGTPLMLLHGIGSAARSFQHQIEGLSDRYRVVAWDAPGYGGSSCVVPAEPTASDYAQALNEFLDAIGIADCHLLGHSLGSLMAVRFAVEFPKRVRSLTLSSIAVGHANLPPNERQTLLDQRLVDVTTLGPRAMAEKRGPRLLGPDATPDMVRRVIDTMGSIRPDGYGQASRMLSHGDVMADMRRLPPDLPVQIVYGDADVITPPARNREVAALRPQAPVHVIPRAGHALYLEKPDAFNAVIANFISA